MDESVKDQLRVGSTFATQPTKRSASSASLDRGLSKRAMKDNDSNDVFLHPITRTPSAQFPMTRAPSRQGLAMIKTTEPSPPPTQLEFEEALHLLYKLEKRLRSEIEVDLRELRRQMTAKKIEYVSNKAQRLYTIRQQLGSCKYLCKQEEEVMIQFDKVKVLLEQQTTIDEDSYQRTKVECLVLGGKLTDIRRRQRRLSGQVEELEMTIKELFNKPLDDVSDEEFDLEAFKRRPLADEPRLAPTMSSYPLFNNAPFGQGPPPIKITTSYSSDSLGFGVSDDGASEIPDNPSPVPPSVVDESDPNYSHYFRYRDTTDVSQDEREENYSSLGAGGARRKKKKRSDFVPRNRTSSMSSDTDAEDGGDEISVIGRMSADEAKRIAENKQRLIDEERKREEAEQQKIRDEIEWKRKAEDEEKEREKLRIEAEILLRRQEEDAKRVEIEAQRVAAEEKKKAELEAKRIAAEEKKKADLEAKRIAAEEKKKADLEAKRIAAEEKKKAELEAKRIAAEEKKKAEVEAKRIAAEEKKKAEDEAKRFAEEEKKKAEIEAKRIAQEEIKRAELEVQRIAAEEKEAQRVAEEERIRFEYISRQQAEEEARILDEERIMAIRGQGGEDQRSWDPEQPDPVEHFSLKDEATNDPSRPQKKGRSASKDRKAAAQVVSDNDDMIYDEEHQISTKEDLFAMIGDTSLKSGRMKKDSESGKKSKKSSISETGDELDARPVSRTSGKFVGEGKGASRKSSDDSKHQIIEDDVQIKSYSSSESMIELCDIEQDEPLKLSTSRPLSRRSSQDRPLGVESKAQKSRTVSRERQKVADEEMESDDFFQGQQKKVRSRTSSNSRREFELEEQMERPQSKQSRSGSRLGTSDTQEPMDVEDDESSFRPPSRSQKSTERPKSRVDQEQELYETDQWVSQRTEKNSSRPGSRAQNSRKVSENERPGESFLDDSDTRRPVSRLSDQRQLKSRTSSRERKDHSNLEVDEDLADSFGIKSQNQRSRRSSQGSRKVSENERLEESFPEESDTRRPVSRLSDQRQLKSRTSSRERKDQSNLEVNEDLTDNFGTRSQNQRSRRSSQDSRPISRNSKNYEEEGIEEVNIRPQSRQSKPQSRTSSNERRGVGVDERPSQDEEDYLYSSDPRPQSRNDYEESDMNADYEYESQGQRLSRVDPDSSQQKSRTSSRDRQSSRLIYEDQAYLEQDVEFSDEDYEGEISQIERKNYISNSRSDYVENDDALELDMDLQEKVTKSRTQSRERPGSRLSMNKEKAGGSRTSSGERQDIGHFSAGENQDIYARIKDKRDILAHSRTTSEDHPGSLGGRSGGYEDEFDDEEVPGLETASKEGSEMEFATRAPLFGINTDQKDPNKSRTSSRERPKTLNLRSREEMESGKDFSRSRTSSRDRREEILRKIQDDVDSMNFDLGNNLTADESEEYFLESTKRVQKSRTASRERPNSNSERSRTHSRERHQADLDQGYNTMGSKLRRYRDEESLDLAGDDEKRGHLLNYNTIDSGIEDYNNFYQEEDALEGQQLGQDDRPIVYEEDDQQNKGGRTKKVSFAESDEKFVLRPDPEVLVIPGTKLFTFAPSSTHEQPPEELAMIQPVQTNGASKSPLQGEERDPLPVIPKPTPRQSPLKEQKAMSASPKAFLKAMLKSIKSSAKDSKERKGLFESLLKKGRSVSLQGSRSSSRQGSVDRGATSEKGFPQNYDQGRSVNQQQNSLGFIPMGSSKATDSSLGSVDLNLEQETSDLESDYSFLKRSGNKKKKPPKVKSVDFDQLFARGHAIEELRERQGQNPFNLIDPYSSAGAPDARDNFFPTPFEVYSKDEAFKRAQQGAGISYEEKVQSYLHDQQHQQGLNNQMFEEFNNESSLIMQNGSHESRKAERKLKRDRSRSDSNKRTQDLSLERKKEQPKVGYSKPEDIRIEQSVEPVLTVEPIRPGSKMSSFSKPADPEEFLFNIQEFVRRAEVDQEYSQPVWPAIIQSPQDLPPMRSSHMRTNSMINPQVSEIPIHRMDQMDGSQLKPNDPGYNLQMFQMFTDDYGVRAEDRPSSPYQIQKAGNNFQERVAPSPGKSYLDMRPSSTVPDPFQYKLDPSEILSGQMESLIPPPPLPSPRRGRSPREDQYQQPAADAHIPTMLKPDPLTAHELHPPPIIPSTLQSTQQLRLADGSDEGQQQTIRDTDLYKRLQEGLKNIDKILASEKFQERIKAAGLEHQKYSHHLGRAEFGVLKKRSGSTACVTTTTDTPQAPMSGQIQKSASAAAINSGIFGKGNLPNQRAGSTQSTALPSRDSSGERPASAMALTGKYQPITARGRTSNLSSRQGSRDSSLGRPDSRLSNYSAMPDLEPDMISNQPVEPVRVINIEPHPEIFEKKKELLQQIALEKLAVREAKVWAEVFLLFVICFCALVYLQSEGQ